MKAGYLTTVILTATFALLATVAYGTRTPDAAAVDTNGNIRVPDGYRVTYQYLGSWAVAVDEGRGSKDLHAVYASPGATSTYRKDGHFPDGAVLVKEVFAAATAPMTTGIVSHAQTLKGWFVMVKDAAGRHSGSKLWGDGWGWSWFDAGNPSRTTSRDYKTDCLGCHIPARSSDWVYVGGYPPLRP
jgi:Cytochrome P460